MTITDASGAPAVALTWFFDPNSRALRNNPTVYTAPDGTVWPAGSGAVIATNQLGRSVRGVINDESGKLLRRVTLPAGGRALKAAALAAAPPPDGPYATLDDLNGVSFDLS
jgi:hypothetical protein